MNIIVILCYGVVVLKFLEQCLAHDSIQKVLGSIIVLWFGLGLTIRKSNFMYACVCVFFKKTHV